MVRPLVLQILQALERLYGIREMEANIAKQLIVLWNHGLKASNIKSLHIEIDSQTHLNTTQDEGGEPHSSGGHSSFNPLT